MEDLQSLFEAPRCALALDSKGPRAPPLRAAGACDGANAATSAGLCTAEAAACTVLRAQRGRRRALSTARIRRLESSAAPLRLALAISTAQEWAGDALSRSWFHLSAQT